MPDTHRSDSDAKGQLFDALSRVTAGMLGVEGSGAHMRPMTHFADRDTGTLWFVTSRDTDLARNIGQGATAHHCIIDEGERFYACLRGAIRPSSDAAKLDDLWSPMVAAWFTGRDDPDLLLVEMALQSAEVWTSTDSSMQFGMEIVRANIKSDAKPDIGEHMEITF